ncbi:MAG TPA: hypothetical protein VHE82_07560 [Gemmatimonadaceae bacterium]|nr:hypothetical protein [Gemmatimonadaceae bacterium]
MRRIRAGVLLIATLATAPSVGYTQEVLETPNARVEVLGLKRWTVPMIQDSLARYAPQDSLTSHACAAVLRMKLKFADAAASYFGRDGAGRELIVVAVVEPQDSALVRYRTPGPDSLPDIAQYAAAIAVFRNHNQDFQHFIQDSAFLVAHSAPRATDARRNLLEPVRRLLLSEHGVDGQRRATQVLARDRNPYNRVMALLVLSGFPKTNTTWLTLADELRDPHGMVSGTASQLITTLARYSPRIVDWSSALDGLEAVMAGTNLFAQAPLIEVLTRTKVAPGLARPLLLAGAPLLLARLRASPQAGRDLARALLEQLSGEHYGQDLAAWTQWVASVQRAGPR